jgi:hypothetical protein
MDVGALASALAGARVAQLQIAVAARLLRMEGESVAAVAEVIEAAQDNVNRLAGVAAGVGANLDLTA